MVASGLEAGAAGVLAVHADAHLERGPQSPCPDSAHTGSVGRRRRNRRGARGTQLQLVAAVVGASQIFFSSMPCSSRCYFRSLLTLLASPNRSSSARCSSTTSSSVGGTFYNNRYSLESSKGTPNLLKLLAHHLVASYTHAHPSIYVTSTTVTHTRVCNTVSNTFPALT